MEMALETIPGPVISNVTITSEFSGSVTAPYYFQRRYIVTFQPDVINSLNVGLQNPLGCYPDYACTNAGCQPYVNMPFLYRYAGQDADHAVQSTISNLASGSGGIQFYTGDRNDVGAFNLGKFVRIHASSQPRLPPGMSPDASFSLISSRKYDIRVVVCVLDPPNGVDDANDIFYTRVILGNDVISSAKESFEFTDLSNTGVWGKKSGVFKSFTTTLQQFTFQGKIPNAGTDGTIRVQVEEVPGLYLQFPLASDNASPRNIVSSDGAGRWYEILVKLPSCQVTPGVTPTSFTTIDGNPIAVVDSSVENVECSRRGMCDRKSGTCSCFSGFYGTACNLQSN
jgi:EGF-like domain